jgi:hypothetical protein
VAHARPEYAITVAVIGVLVAIGAPALREGRLVVGGLCLAVALAVAGWALRNWIRERWPGE